MKIIQINAVYSVGSTGRNVKELHEYLIKNKIESYVFVGSREELSKNVFTIGNILDWKLHAILSRISGLQGYFSHIPTLIMLKKIKKIKPDIVLLHNLHSNYINIKLLLNYLSKNNVITMIILHDCWFFTGRCWHYIANNCSGIKNKCNKCMKLYYGNSSWFFDRAGKMYNDKEKLINKIKNLYVIGVSKWIENEARKSFFNSKNMNIDYQYNWVDLELFKPNEAKNENSKKTILSVASSWSINKGIYDIKKVAEKLPNYDFLIVGDQQMKIKFSKNIKLIPSTNNINELINYYQKSDVFLNLSRQETFGKVTAEALSCGLPVIGYNATATKELVSDGCGYLSNIGDIEDVINNINKIIKDGKNKYSNNARQFAIRNFNKEKILNKWLIMFKSAIEKKK